MSLPSASGRKKFAILISGRGSNMLAIAGACADGFLPGEIAFVGSDKADAPGLAAASAMGLPTRVFPYRDGKEAAEAAIISAVTEAGAEYIALAGFMRLLSPAFVERFPNRIVNIHPSLLPNFPGAHAIRDALAARAVTTGVTIHIVDEFMDHGPILTQAAVPIKPEDTEESLAERIHALEHMLYPAVLKDLFAKECHC